MTVIHPAVFNALIDANIPRIILMINPTNKALTFNKGTCLGTIYKYIDISYIITDFIKAIIAIAVTSTTVSEPFITI